VWPFIIFQIICLAVVTFEFEPPSNRSAILAPS